MDSSISVACLAFLALAQETPLSTMAVVFLASKADEFDGRGKPFRDRRLQAGTV